MPHKKKFEIYRDRQGDFRWRLIASNGRIIADCGEGYSSKQGVKNGIVNFCDAVVAEVVDKTVKKR